MCIEGRLNISNRWILRWSLWFHALQNCSSRYSTLFIGVINLFIDAAGLRFLLLLDVPSIKSKVFIILLPLYIEGPAFVLELQELPQLFVTFFLLEGVRALWRHNVIALGGIIQFAVLLLASWSSTVSPIAPVPTLTLTTLEPGLSHLSEG